MNGTLLKHSDKILAVHQQHIFLGANDSWQFINTKDISRYLGEGVLLNQDFQYIGEHNDCSYYVVEVLDALNLEEWVNLRQLAAVVSDIEYLMVSRGLQLVTWAKQHQFCGQCGIKTRPYVVEPAALECSACSLVFYPRISPCMMCLIVKGEYCLLAHHQHHKEGLYATLAGFVEAGESLEQTVHREVMEEVGLKVDGLRYFSSQSWPFPHQLMVGYFANYVGGDIAVDGEEIIDAQWFHYSMLPEIPTPSTLSGQLIQKFVSWHQTK